MAQYPSSAPMVSRPSRTAASMLAVIRGQAWNASRPSGLSAFRRARSGHCSAASAVHWTDVWWSLFFFTPTAARQSRHSTRISLAWV